MNLVVQDHMFVLRVFFHNKLTNQVTKHNFQLNCYNNIFYKITKQASQSSPSLCSSTSPCTSRQYVHGSRVSAGSQPHRSTSKRVSKIIGGLVFGIFSQNNPVSFHVAQICRFSMTTPRRIAYKMD